MCAQIALSCARFRSWPLKITESKNMYSVALVCAQLRPFCALSANFYIMIKFCWILRSIAHNLRSFALICAQSMKMFSVALNFTERNWAQLSAIERKLFWAQFKYFILCKWRQLSATERKQAPWHQVCTQLRSELKTGAKWAQMSAKRAKLFALVCARFAHICAHICLALFCAVA